MTHSALNSTPAMPGPEPRRRHWPGAALAALLALALLLALAASGPARAAVERGFDHFSTGYPLTGAHAALRCESCHVNGTMKGTPRDCESCHTPGAPLARANTVRPARHVPAVGTCADCHSTRSFSVNNFNHSTVQTTGCQTCHNGNGATGKTPRHVPVAGNQSCGDCHRTTRSWTPAAFNHTQAVVRNNCFSCHDGLHDGASGRPPTHVPGLFVAGEGINNCDTCHLDAFGFRSWTPARVHAFTNIRSQCATCHTGAYPPAVGQPNTPSHAGAPPQCEVCHRDTRNWSNVVFVGSSAALNQALGGRSRAAVQRPGQATAAVAPSAVPALPGLQSLPPRHIPVQAAPCSACHRSATNLSIAVRMNHGAVRAIDCRNCHNGAFVSQGNAGARPAGAQHIPYRTALLNGSSMDCDDCHRGGGGAGWSAVRMDHNNSVGGGGGGLCKSCHQTGTAVQGSMQKQPLAHVRGSRTPLDCSSSECHAPLGRVGVRFRAWR
jgi:predicted CXXCH cytochrome family protein